MRLLLLLSALLSSLCGVVSGAAFAGAQVETSAAAAEREQDAAQAPARPIGPVAVPLATAAWHAAPAPLLAADRPLYADRLRE
jgi:hypothetical protein